MSDVEPSQTSRISRSMIARLVAAGLFLTAGTTAVVHTVNRRTPQSAQTTTQKIPNPPQADGETSPTANGAALAAISTPDKPETANAQDSAKNDHATSPPPVVSPLAGQAKLQVAVEDAPQDRNQKPSPAPPLTLSNSPSQFSLGDSGPANEQPGSSRSSALGTNNPPPLLSANQASLSATAPSAALSLGTPNSAGSKPPPIVRGSISVEPESNGQAESAATDSPTRRSQDLAEGGALRQAPAVPSGSPLTPSLGSAGTNPLVPRATPSAPPQPLKSDLDTAEATAARNPAPAALLGAGAAVGAASAGQKSVAPAAANNAVEPQLTANPPASAGPPDLMRSASTAAPSGAPGTTSGSGSPPPPSTFAAPTNATPPVLNTNTLVNKSTPKGDEPRPSPNMLGETPPKSPAASPSFNTGVPRPDLPTTPTVRSPNERTGWPSDGGNAAPRMATAAKPVPGDSALQGPQNTALKIQKIAPSEVQLGQAADFQIVLQNDSDTAVTGIVVHDRVPDGATLISSEPRPEALADGTLVWQFPSLAAQQSTTIQLKLRPDRPGHFGSVAQVTFSALATASTRCTKPVLEVSIDSQPQALIGDEIPFNITVRNSGDGPAENVYLQDSVPTGLEFPNGLSQIEYDIGTLAPGDQRQVQLRLKANKVGAVINRIAALADGDLQASDETELLVVAPELRAAADGPSRKYLDREAKYEFAVTNAGTARATNVNLVAALPKGLKFVDANNYGQYDPPSHSVYWSMPELAASLVGKVELVALPVEPGSQTIDFRVTADLNQQAATQARTEVEAIVEVACEIDDTEDPIELDRQTVYNVHLINQGNHPATQVRLVVDFPPGLTPVQVGGGLRSQIQGQRVLFEAIPRLDSNQDVAISITARGGTAGDHRVVASLATDGRETPISKEESTRVYSDRD